MPLAMTYATLLAFASDGHVGCWLFHLLQWASGSLFVALFLKLIPQPEPGRRYFWLGKLAICCACIAVVAVHILRIEERTRPTPPLVTARGTVRVPGNLLESYQTAIRFMQDKLPQGKKSCPFRGHEFVFSVRDDLPYASVCVQPRRLAPGKMVDDTIREIERKPVRYLLWSNRTYPDFGTLSSVWISMFRWATISGRTITRSGR